MQRTGDGTYSVSGNVSVYNGYMTFEFPLTLEIVSLSNVENSLLYGDDHGNKVYAVPTIDPKCVALGVEVAENYTLETLTITIGEKVQNIMMTKSFVIPDSGTYTFNAVFKEIIEPLNMLFKDEVRQLGRELGLPEYLVSRQPFPGPGLAIRIIGDITKEKADTLRQADFIFREEIAKTEQDKCLSQYFAVLTNTRSVGVMGDGRTYDYTLALRAVTTDDFMTADWARIPYEVLDRISVRIVNEVRGINRIVYDITSKPPATVEWE